MKITYKCLLFIVLFLPAVYIFTWIHEGGHALTIILTGNVVTGIEVDLLGGMVHVYYNDYSARWIVTIMGGVSVLLVAVPFFIYSFRKKNMGMFIIAFYEIAKETLYWGNSPYKQYGDAYTLIQWAQYYNLKNVVVVVYITTIVAFIITGLLYALFMYYIFRWMILRDRERERERQRERQRRYVIVTRAKNIFYI